MQPTGGSSGPPPTRLSPRPWPCPGCGGGWGPGHEKRMPDLRTGDGAMTVLELKDVSKAYGQGPARVEALHGVDLTVEAGGMVAVMGPSGSGKSTLLTIAGSLEEPTSGDVLVCGLALAGMPRGRKVRR